MTFDQWFQSQQGKAYYSYYDFAKAAWEYQQEQLQDKLKNAERYEWLRMQYMEVEFVTKDRQVTFIESFKTSEEDAVYLDKEIDSARGKG